MKSTDVVSYLSSPEAFPECVDEVTIKETHTAYIFLAGRSAFKMKKPVKLPFLDFSTLEKRKFILEQEREINQDLAGPVYKQLLAVTKEPNGTFALAGNGPPVEWLLEMVRLPESEMLKQRLLSRNVSVEEIHVLAQRLSDFYEKTDRSADNAATYLKHLRQGALINKEHLVAMKAYLQPCLSLSGLQLAIELIDKNADEIRQRVSASRVAAGLIVDGHGDLRPEHIYMTSPSLVIDRLEFDDSMRRIDIYDEASYLGIECEMAGFGWVRNDLLEIVNGRFHCPPSRSLQTTYILYRLFLGARLAIDHLLEPFPRHGDKWPDLAKERLRKAGEISARFCLA